MKFLHRGLNEDEATDETEQVVYALFGKEVGLMLWSPSASGNPRILISIAERRGGPGPDPVFVADHTHYVDAVPELLDMLGDAAQWLEKNCERTDGVWRKK